MWDEQIDDVARRLTAAPPPPGLRLQVLRRLQERNQPRVRERTRAIVWRLTPVLAIVLVVLSGLRAGWHVRGGRSSNAPHSVAVQHVAPGATPATASGLHAPAVSGATVRLEVTAGSVVNAGPTARAPVPRPVRRPSPREETPDFIERLAIVPLSVGSLGLDRIAPPASIEPSALEVAPLTMVPASTGDPGRN